MKQFDSRSSHDTQAQWLVMGQHEQWAPLREGMAHRRGVGVGELEAKGVSFFTRTKPRQESKTRRSTGAEPSQEPLSALADQTDSCERWRVCWCEIWWFPPDETPTPPDQSFQRQLAADRVRISCLVCKVSVLWLFPFAEEKGTLDNIYYQIDVSCARHGYRTRESGEIVLFSKLKSHWLSVWNLFSVFDPSPREAVSCRNSQETFRGLTLPRQSLNVSSRGGIGSQR